MAIIEIHDNYSELGIQSRQITQGQEFDMVQEFIEFRKETFKEKSTKQLAIFLETKINGSYPDIVFAEYNPYSYESWKKSRNNLSINDMKILHYIFINRKVTSQKIVSDLSINYKDLLFSLERLFDSALIDRENEAWVNSKKEIFGVSKVEAIEAKISKWDQAMQQALINRSFASESSVLAKKKNNPKLDIIDKMSTFGIGIYLYDNCNFSTVASAKKTKFPCNYNSIYINECIGRILNYC